MPELKLTLNKNYLARRILPLVLIMLVFSGFMGYRGIDYFSIVYILFGVGFAVYSVFLLRGAKHILSSYYDVGIVALMLIIYLSFIPGLIWGGQSVYYSLRGAFGLLYSPIFLYIFLQKKAFSEIDIKRCLCFFFFLYIIVYFYAYLRFPEIRFSQNFNELDKIIADYEQRGVMRLNIPFEDLIALGIFYFINNPLKNRKYNIGMLSVLIILTFLRGTRSLMFATVVIAGLLLLKQSKKKLTANKVLITVIELSVVGLLVFMIFKVSGLSDILGSFKEVSETDFDAGEDYIRWIMAGFYLTQYNTSAGEYFFGHGIPVSGDFQRDVLSYSDLGFYPEDIGYVEFFVNFGILGLIVLAWIFFSILGRKVDSKSYYAKYYLYYLFLASFLGRYILSNMILFVLMLYIVKISKNENSDNISIPDASC